MYLLLSLCFRNTLGKWWGMISGSHSSTSLYLERRILILFLPALTLSARILSEFFFQVQTVLAGKSNSSHISWSQTLSYRILHRISAFLHINNWFLHNRFGLCIVGFARGFLGGFVILAEICCWSWFEIWIEKMEGSHLISWIGLIKGKGFDHEIRSQWPWGTIWRLWCRWENKSVQFCSVQPLNGDFYTEKFNF